MANLKGEARRSKLEVIMEKPGYTSLNDLSSITASRETFQLLRHTFDLDPKLVCLPNIEFYIEIDHIVSILEHEFEISEDEVVFAQILSAQKSKLGHLCNVQINNVQRRKCQLTQISPEKLRLDLLDEIRMCITKSCERYKTFKSSGSYGNLPDDIKKSTVDLTENLRALLTVLDGRISKLKRLAYNDILPYCWQYLEDATKGLKQQKSAVTNILDALSEDLSRKRRATDNREKIIQTSSLHSLQKQAIDCCAKVKRLGGGQSKDSIQEVYSNKLLAITNSLQNIAETLLDGVNKSIQDCLDTENKKSHLIVELRHASLNSDLYRAEMAARAFTNFSDLDTEESQRKDLIVSRLQSIDQLNLLISDMENEIESLRQKHTDAVEELMNKRKSLKLLVGELGKMKHRIDELLSHIGTKQIDYDKRLKCLEAERLRILNDPNLTESMRELQLKRLNEELERVMQEHKADMEGMGSKLALLREEAMEQQGQVERELLINIEELENQLLTASESQKELIRARIAALRSQLDDAARLGEEEWEGEGEGAMEEEEQELKTSEKHPGTEDERTTEFDEYESSEFSENSASESISSLDEAEYVLCQELGYTKAAVGKLIVAALVDCAKRTPANPIDHISGFIRHRVACQQKQEHRRKQNEALCQERERLRIEMETTLLDAKMHPNIPESIEGEDGGNWDWNKEENLELDG